MTNLPEEFILQTRQLMGEERFNRYLEAFEEEAPVSIQVTAAGSDPEAVGRSIYDVAEQYLLRTLNTAY